MGSYSYMLLLLHYGSSKWRKKLHFLWDLVLQNSNFKINLALKKILDVNVDPEEKFSKHIEIQINKVDKILGFINRSYNYRDNGI